MTHADLAVDQSKPSCKPGDVRAKKYDPQAGIMGLMSHLTSSCVIAVNRLLSYHTPQEEKVLEVHNLRTVSSSISIRNIMVWR